MLRNGDFPVSTMAVLGSPDVLKLARSIVCRDGDSGSAMGRLFSHLETIDTHMALAGAAGDFKEVLATIRAQAITNGSIDFPLLTFDKLIRSGGFALLVKVEKQNQLSTASRVMSQASTPRFHTLELPVANRC